MRNKNLLLVFLVPIVCVGIALGFGHKAFAADIAGVCSSVLDSFADTTGGGGSDTSGGGGCSDHGCGCYSGVSFAYFKFSNGNGYGSVNGVTMNCGSQYEGVWVMMRRQSGTNCSTRNSLFRVVTIGTASAYGGDADYITGSVSCGSSSKGICGVNATLSGLYTYDYNISLSSVRDKCYEADTNGLCDSIFRSGSSYSWFCANYNPQPVITYSYDTQYDWGTSTTNYTTSSTATASPYVAASISGLTADSTSNGTTYYTAPESGNYPAAYTVNLQYGGRRTDTNSPTSASFWFSALGPGTTSVASGRVSLAYSTSNSLFAYSNGTAITASGNISVDWRSSTDNSYPTAVCGTMKMKPVTYTYYWTRTDTTYRTRSVTYEYTNGTWTNTYYGTWSSWQTYSTGTPSADTSYPHTNGYTTSDGAEVSSTRCATIRGPQEKVATFSGSVAVSPDSNLTGNVTSNTTSNALEGDGLHSKYYFDTTYTIKRTNSTPTNATSQYNFNSGANYPTTAAWTTGNLTNNSTENLTGGSSSPHRYNLNVDIGGTASLCFNLSFDANVTYRYTTPYSRDFAGRQRTCVQLTNPAKTYSTTFAASTTGWLTSGHDRFNLSNCDSSNHCMSGTLDNATRNNDGTWSDAFASDDHYYATFTHRLWRTDADNPVFTLPTSTGTHWQVQAQVDGGDWSVVTSDATYNNPAFTHSVGSSNAQVVYNHTDVTAAIMNARNKGKYTTYCQRLSYYNIVEYTTATNTVNRDSYTVERINPSSVVNTTPVCVIVKNPLWEERDDPTYNENSTERIHNITVTGSTTGVTFGNNAAVHTTGENYVATKVAVTAYFDHSLIRHDSQDSSGLAGFDESQQYAFGTTALKFYPAHGTMYSSASTSPFTVDTAFSGRESINGRADVLEKSPMPNSQTVLQRYGINDFFLATDKNTNRTWNSSASTGRTYTPFNVSSSRDLYTLRAGTANDKRLCYTTYNTRAAWLVRYKDIDRRAAYYSGSTLLTNSDQTTSWVYDRTELVSNSPELTNPADHVSNPLCINLHRDWNFEIQSVEPSDIDNIQSASQTVSTDFTITVGRDPGWNDGVTRDFITDVDSQISIITYVIKENTNRTNINTATTGGTYGSTDFCSFFSNLGVLDTSVAGISACTVTDPGSGRNKVKSKTADQNSDGVYNDTSYDVTFSTGDIEVPTVPVGDKFCVAVGIHTRSSTSSQSFISRSTCTNLSKRPAVHVWGGSVSSFGGIKTSLTEIEESDSDAPKKRFGSWTDLGIIANKPVTRMSSGNSIVAKYDATTLYVPCDVSPLTIANSMCQNNNASKTGYAGVATTTSMVDKLLARYAGAETAYEGNAGSTITIDSAFFARSEVMEKLHITDSSKIEGVDPLVIYSKSDVIINTNLKLNPNMRYTGVHVPQLIIIADGNINIAESVTEVDAWLIARGEIDTCTNADGSKIQLNSRRCAGSNPDEDQEGLRINGPVLATKINLKRTAGADLYMDIKKGTNLQNISSAAELINLSPAAYLFGINESQKSGQPRVTYVRELAPRF